MPRLFVAIDMAPEIKTHLSEIKTDIPTARWTRPEQMHLTLRFIGADVPNSKVKPIKDALSTIESPPFDLTLSGVGRFPSSNKKAPRVLWVGIQKQPALMALHQQVEKALVTVGFKPEDRDFNAHITLARLKTHKPTPEADAFLETHADFNAGTFTATEFILYNSQLTPQGPRYTHEAVYSLESSISQTQKET